MQNLSNSPFSSLQSNWKPIDQDADPRFVTNERIEIKAYEESEHTVSLTLRLVAQNAFERFVTKIFQKIGLWDKNTEWTHLVNKDTETVEIEDKIAPNLEKIKKVLMEKIEAFKLPADVVKLEGKTELWSLSSELSNKILNAIKKAPPKEPAEIKLETKPLIGRSTTPIPREEVQKQKEEEKVQTPTLRRSTSVREPVQEPVQGPARRSSSTSAPMSIPRLSISEYLLPTEPLSRARLASEKPTVAVEPKPEPSIKTTEAPLPTAPAQASSKEAVSEDKKEIQKAVGKFETLAQFLQESLKEFLYLPSGQPAPFDAQNQLRADAQLQFQVISAKQQLSRLEELGDFLLADRLRSALENVEKISFKSTDSYKQVEAAIDYLQSSRDEAVRHYNAADYIDLETQQQVSGSDISVIDQLRTVEKNPTAYSADLKTKIRERFVQSTQKEIQETIKVLNYRIERLGQDPFKSLFDQDLRNTIIEDIKASIPNLERLSKSFTYNPADADERFGFFAPQLIKKSIDKLNTEELSLWSYGVNAEAAEACRIHSELQSVTWSIDGIHYQFDHLKKEARDCREKGADARCQIHGTSDLRCRGKDGEWRQRVCRSAKQIKVARREISVSR